MRLRSVPYIKRIRLTVPPQKTAFRRGFAPRKSTLAHLSEDFGQGSRKGASAEEGLKAVGLSHLVLGRSGEVHRLTVPVDSAILEGPRVT